MNPDRRNEIPEKYHVFFSVTEKWMRTVSAADEDAARQKVLDDLRENEPREIAKRCDGSLAFGEIVKAVT
ncbi:MAG: hypothetical protein HQ567_12570 [Candidatus Nealsonbacteria bacterium]|nr:hypothetical protein [Candidatus Nealsonbacteria bacterium]